jgi:hypothetical protein
METKRMGKLIAIKEFCSNYKIEISFVSSLQKNGLLETTTFQETEFIDEEQLRQLEKMVCFYYELDINLEGIEAIMHLLQRMNSLQDEMITLKNRLHFYETEAYERTKTISGFNITNYLNILKMKDLRQLGIWMDHSNAYVMALTDDTIEERKIVLESIDEEKEDHGNSEKHIHTKEQNKQSSYYKKLSDIIKDYKEVLLFGPTDAKEELFNLIKADHFFDNIKIEVKHADKMNETPMHNFVREYFK